MKYQGKIGLYMEISSGSKRKIKKKTLKKDGGLGEG